jgi:phage terminase large subunit-like protein
MTVPAAPGDYPHVALAEGYVDDVLSGMVPACKWVKAAAARHRRDASNEAIFFNPEAAERACRFVERMPHIKGRWAAGDTPLLLRLEPWQCFIECMIFGWLRSDTGKRRFRRVYIEVPRKNAKSTVTAANGLLMLCADGEHGAEVYSGATSEKQAWEVFGPAKLMAKGRPALLRQFGIVLNAKNINIPAKACKFEPLIGKPGDGASPSCAIIDEYHEHSTSEQVDTMLTGMGAREQPLIWIITTAGDNVAGPCYDERLTVQKILLGAIEDDATFGIIYTIDDDVDWTSDEAIRQANPNLDVSIDMQFLRDRLKEAVRNPRDQARYKTKHLNLWINSRSAFFNMQKWAACKTAPALADMPDGAECIIGLDLASKLDIAALEMVFPQADGTVIRHGLHYLPEATVEDPANGHYAGWRAGGRLTVTDGEITDYHRIRDDLLDLTTRFRVLAVAYDQHQATMFVTELMSLGIEVSMFPMVATTMSEPMKQLDALIVSGKLRHDCEPNDPMTWMMSNVTGRPDAKENVYPRKERNELKIDGPVALMMALGRLMARDAEAFRATPAVLIW